MLNFSIRNNLLLILKLVFFIDLISLLKAETTCKEEWNALSLNSTSWSTIGDVSVENKTGHLTFFRDANDKTQTGDVGGIAWYKVNRNGLTGIKISFTPVVTVDLNYYGNVKYPQGFAIVFTGNQINGIIGNKRSGLGYDGIDDAIAFEWDFIQNADKNDIRDVHFSAHYNLNGRISSASPSTCDEFCNVKLSNFYDPQKLGYVSSVDYSLEIFGGKLSLYENGVAKIKNVEFPYLDQLMEGNQVFMGVSAAMNLYKAVTIQNLQFYRIGESSKPVISIPNKRQSYPAGVQLTMNYFINSVCGVPLKIFASQATKNMQVTVNEMDWSNYIEGAFDPVSYSYVLNVRNLVNAGSLTFSPNWKSVNGADLEVTITPGEVTKYDICDIPYDPVTNIVKMSANPVGNFVFTICSTDQFKNSKSSTYTSDDQIVKVDYPHFIPAETKVVVVPNLDKTKFTVTIPLTGLGVYTINNEGFFNGSKKTFEVKLGSAASDNSYAEISNYFQNKNAKVNSQIILYVHLRDDYGNVISPDQLTALNCTLSASTIEHTFGGATKPINLNLPNGVAPVIDGYAALTYTPSLPGQYVFKPRVQCAAQRATDLRCDLCTFFISTSEIDTTRFKLYSDFKDTYVFSGDANPLFISLDESKNRKLTTIRFVDTSGMDFVVSQIDPAKISVQLKQNLNVVTNLNAKFNPTGVVDLFMDAGKEREGIFSPLAIYYLSFGVNDANLKMATVTVPVQFAYKDDYMNNINLVNNVDSPANFIATFMPGTFKLRAASVQLLYKIMARNAANELTTGQTLDTAKVSLVATDNFGFNVTIPTVAVKTGIFIYVSTTFNSAGYYFIDLFYDNNKLENVTLNIIPRPEVSALTFDKNSTMIQSVTNNTISLIDGDVASPVAFMFNMVDIFGNVVNQDYLAIFNSISISTVGSVSVNPLISGQVYVVFNDKTPGLSSVSLTLPNTVTYSVSMTRTSLNVDASLSTSAIVHHGTVGQPVTANVILSDKLGNNISPNLNAAPGVNSTISNLNVFLVAPGKNIIPLSFTNYTNGGFLFTADSNLMTNAGEYQLSVFYQNIPVTCSLCWANLVPTEVDLQNTAAYILGYKSEVKLYSDGRYALHSTKERDLSFYLIFRDNLGNEIINKGNYNLALTNEATRTNVVNFCMVTQATERRQYYNICAGDDQSAFAGLKAGKYSIQVDKINFKVYLSNSYSESIDTPIVPSSNNSFVRNEDSIVVGSVDSPARIVIDFRSDNYLRFSDLDVEKITISPAVNITDLAVHFIYGPANGLVTGILHSKTLVSTTLTISYDSQVVISNVPFVNRPGQLAKVDYLQNTTTSNVNYRYYFFQLSDAAGNPPVYSNLANTLANKYFINIFNQKHNSFIPTVNSYNAATGVFAVGLEPFIVGDLRAESLIGNFNLTINGYKSSFNSDNSFVFADGNSDLNAGSSLRLNVQPMDRSKNYLSISDVASYVSEFSMIVSVTRGGETKYVETVTASVDASNVFFNVKLAEPGDYLFIPYHKRTQLSCNNCRRLVLPGSLSLSATTLQVKTSSGWYDKHDTMVFTMFQHNFPLFKLTFRDGNRFALNNVDLTKYQIQLLTDSDVVLSTKVFQTGRNGVLVYLSQEGRNSYNLLSALSKLRLSITNSSDKKVFSNFIIFTSDKSSHSASTCANDAVPTFSSTANAYFKAGSDLMLDFALKGCPSQEASLSDNDADFTIDISASSVKGKVIPAEANGKYILILTGTTKTQTNLEKVSLKYLSSESSAAVIFSVTADYSIGSLVLSSAGSFTSANQRGYFYISAYDKYSNQITEENVSLLTNDLFVDVTNSEGNPVRYKVTYSPSEVAFMAQFTILGTNTITVSSKYSANPLTIEIRPSEDAYNSEAVISKTSETSYEASINLRDERLKSFTSSNITLTTMFSFKYFTFNTVTGEVFTSDLPLIRLKDGNNSTIVITLPSDMPLYHYSAVLPVYNKVYYLVCNTCFTKNENLKYFYMFNSDDASNNYLTMPTSVTNNINNSKEKLAIVYESSSAVNATFSTDSQIGNVNIKISDTSYFTFVVVNTVAMKNNVLTGLNTLNFDNGVQVHFYFDASVTPSVGDAVIANCRIISERSLTFTAGSRANLFVEVRDKDNLLTSKKVDITLSVSDVSFNVMKTSFAGIYLVEILSDVIPQSTSFKLALNRNVIPTPIGINVRAAFPQTLEVQTQQIIDWTTVQYNVVSTDAFNNVVCDSRLSLVVYSGPSLVSYDLFYDSEAEVCRVLFYFSGYAVLTSPLFSDNAIMKLDNVEAIRISYFSSSIILDQNNSQNKSDVTVTLKLVSNTGFVFPSDIHRNGMSIVVYSLYGMTSKVLVKEIPNVNSLINVFTLADLNISSGDYLINAMVDGSNLLVSAPFRVFTSGVQVASSLVVNLKTGSNWSVLSKIYDPSVLVYEKIVLPYPFSMMINFINSSGTKISLPGTNIVTTLSTKSANSTYIMTLEGIRNSETTFLISVPKDQIGTYIHLPKGEYILNINSDNNNKVISKNIYISIANGLLQKNNIGLPYAMPNDAAGLVNPLDIVGTDSERTISTNVGSYSRTNLCIVSQGMVYNNYLSPELFSINGLDSKNCDVYTTLSLRGCIEFAVKCNSPSNGNQLSVNYDDFSITSTLSVLIDPKFPPSSIDIISAFPKSAQQMTGISTTFNLLDSAGDKFQYVTYDNFEVYVNNLKLDNSQWQLYYNQNLTLNILELDYPPREQNVQVMFKDSTGGYIRLDNLTTTVSVSQGAFDLKKTVLSVPSSYHAGEDFSFIAIMKDAFGNCFEDTVDTSLVSASLNLGSKSKDDFEVTAQILDFPLCRRVLKFTTSTPLTSAGSFKLEGHYNNTLIAYTTVNVLPNKLSPSRSHFVVTGLGAVQSAQMKAGSTLEIQMTGTDAYYNLVSYYNIAEKLNMTIDGLVYNEDYFFSAKIDDTKTKVLIHLTVNSLGSYALNYLMDSQPFLIESGLKSIIVTAGVCSSKIPNIVSPVVNLYSGDYGTISINCLDDYGNAVMEKGNENFDISIKGRNLEIVGEDQVPYDFGFNTGTYTAKFLMAYQGVYDISIYLNGNNYGAAFNVTVLSQKCPAQSPVMCSTRNCVQNITQCTSDTDTLNCASDKPFYCKVEGTKTCVARTTECDCSSGFTKCNGNCLPVNATNVCLNPITSNCQRKMGSDNYFSCPDGSCRSANSRCPNSLGCPLGFKPCGISCINRNSTCSVSSPTCGSSQVMCWDMSCQDSLESCPTGKTCADKNAVVCPDGKCVADQTQCTQPPSCSEPYNYLCPDYTCKKSASDCLSRPVCFPGQTLCEDNTCSFNCTKAVSCPLDHFLCATGQCVSNVLLCPTPISCPSGWIKCPSGSCAKTIDQCNFVSGSNSLTCPLASPILCADLSCVTDFSQCKSVPSCPAESPFRCPNNECRTSLSNCPSLPVCPAAYPVLCSDGTCQKASYHCASSAAANTCSNVRCSDGSCVNSVLLCPSQVSCGLNQVKCWDGACVNNVKDCRDPKYIDCPNTMPFRCPDGSCRPDKSSCSTVSVCPKDRPVKCYDSSCRENIALCPPFQSCGNNMFSCPDGTCSSTSCNTIVTCPSGMPFLCYDNTCKSDIRDCPQPPTCSGVTCPDGSCVSNRQLCKYFEPCPPLNPIRCQSGSCSSTVDKCYSVSRECPIGFIKCPTGGCKINAALCPSFTCPDNLPFQCPEGACVENASQCDIASNGCPYNLPYKCIDGTCVRTLLECSKYSNATCVGSSFLCPDGSCRANYNDCPLANGCPKEKPLKCSNGVCIDPAVSTCSPPSCSFDRPIKCQSGECVSTSANCPSSVKEEDYKACESIGLGGNYMCADGRCLPSPDFCKPLYNCRNGYTKCSDGTCKLSSSLCPQSSNCPNSRPVACSSGKCVENNSQCFSNIICPPDSPVRCDKTGECVSNSTLCPGTELTTNGCPSTSPVKCADGRCMNSAELCRSVNIACTADSPTLCPDGTCKSSAADCAGIQDTCQPGYSRCPDGTCADSNTFWQSCKNKIGCPLVSPIRCSDGSCVNDKNQCPTVIACNSATPVLCADKSCVTDSKFCNVVTPCPASSPLRCSNGYCAVDQSACDSLQHLCPLSSPIKCPSGKCAQSLKDCSQEYLALPCKDSELFCAATSTCVTSASLCVTNASGSKSGATSRMMQANLDNALRMTQTVSENGCSSLTPFSCYDGTCRAKREECPLLPACNAMEYRCPNGSCKKDQSKCKDAISMVCDTGLSQCEDGLCRKTCPAFNGCDLANPFQCTNGMCVKNLNECIGFSMCNSATPFRCIDGTCVTDPSTCPNIRRLNPAQRMSVSVSIFNEVNVAFAYDRYKHNIGSLFIPGNSLKLVNSTSNYTVINVEEVVQSPLYQTVSYNNSDALVFNVSNGIVGSDGYLTYENSVLSSVVKISGVGLSDALLHAGRIRLEHNYYLYNVFLASDYCLAKLVDSKWICVDRKVSDDQTLFRIDSFGTYAVVLNPYRQFTKIDPSAATSFFFDNIRTIAIILSVLFAVFLTVFYVFTRVIRYREKYKEHKEMMINMQSQIEEYKNMSTDVPGQTVGDNIAGIVFTMNPARTTSNVAKGSAFDLENEIEEIQRKCRAVESQNRSMESKIQDVSEMYKMLKMDIDSMKQS